jgi:hypothetical protein
LNRPVRLSALAARDLQEARDWFDSREPGLGDTFLERVNDTIRRISENPLQYQVAVLDLAARSRPSTSPFDLVQSLAGRVHCRRGAERSERHQIGAWARDSEGGTVMTSR